MVNLENLGVPSLYIATSEFVDAAEVQGTALGCRPAAVFVRHPIQDRTDPEMREIADAAIEEIVAKLVAGPPGDPAS